MRVNRRVSNEQRAQFLVDTGKQYHEDRGSGRTTAEALSLLGTAMMVPGAVYKAKHFIEHGANDACAQANLVQLALTIASSLSLEHFTLPDSVSLRYDIFLEV